MCNIKRLLAGKLDKICLLLGLTLVGLGPSCRSSSTQTGEPGSVSSVQRPALPLERIAIVGASVSAGFGGLPFVDAFAVAAKRSEVDTAASTFLFRDPIGDTKRQLSQAAAFKPTVIVALDLLFWDVYGSRDPGWRRQALETALAELDAARTAGAWIVLGDIPLITTASELMLPRESVPDPASLAAANDVIRAWAQRERVLMVPLAEWTEPLRSGAEVKLPTGEKVSAQTLMAIDGLHANPDGTWYLLDRLDRFIEEKLPGTPKDALVFERPKT